MGDCTRRMEGRMYWGMKGRMYWGNEGENVLGE